jgi:hypothetical protein
MKITYLIIILMIISFSGFAEDVFYILPDGKIGIGTDTPAEDIEVEGDVKVSGDVLIEENKSFHTTRIYEYNLNTQDYIRPLPDPATYTGNVIVLWKNGTNNNHTLTFTIDPPGNQYISGVEVTKWSGEGKGKIVLYSRGSAWWVESYIDSGTTTNGSFIKYQDGYMEQWGKKNTSSSPLTITFPIEFLYGPVVTNSVPLRGYFATIGTSNPATDSFDSYCRSLDDGSSCSVSVTHHWHARGRWY